MEETNFTQTLQKRYQKEVVFFKSLARATTRFQTQKLLNTASGEQLELLSYIIHCIVVGNIPIDEHSYTILQNKKKINYLENNFSDYGKLSCFFPDSARPHLLDILYKLVSVLPTLLGVLVSQKDVPANADLDTSLLGYGDDDSAEDSN